MRKTHGHCTDSNHDIFFLHRGTGNRIGCVFYDYAGCFHKLLLRRRCWNEYDDRNCIWRYGNFRGTQIKSARSFYWWFFTCIFRPVYDAAAAGFCNRFCSNTDSKSGIVSDSGYGSAVKLSHKIVTKVMSNL